MQKNNSKTTVPPPKGKGWKFVLEQERNGILNSQEIVTAICHAFCQGASPTAIVEQIKSQYGIHLSREVPYAIIASRASSFRFMAPRLNELSQKLLAAYPFLQRAEVICSPAFRPVATRAAELVVQMIQNFAFTNAQQRAMHIGFSGGHSVALVAEEMSLLFKHTQDIKLPPLEFHNLVGGFDREGSRADANTFFQWYRDLPSHISIKFSALHAPAVIQKNASDPVNGMKSERQKMLNLPGIKQAKEAVDNGLDLIITSCGNSFEHPHGMLYSFYTQYAPLQKDLLMAANCAGDLMWMPLGKDAPIDPEVLDCYPFTLVTLTELPALIQKGTKILLVLGPCNECEQTKADSLKAVLSQRLVTHVVTSNRTAEGLFAPPKKSATIKEPS